MRLFNWVDDINKIYKITLINETFVNDNYNKRNFTC